MLHKVYNKNRERERERETNKERGGLGPADKEYGIVELRKRVSESEFQSLVLLYKTVFSSKFFLEH